MGDMTAKLRSKFPSAFPWPPRPLQIGIYRTALEAIAPADVGIAAAGGFDAADYPTGRALSAALGQWTGSDEYLAACVVGAVRVDLNGNPAGEVSEDEAAWAAEEIKRRASNERLDKAAAKRRR
jgi:ProP effector